MGTSEKRTEAEKEREKTTSAWFPVAREKGVTTEYFLAGKHHFSSTAFRKAPGRVPGSWVMFSKY